MTDRIPPHSLEAEQRLLGNIMLNSECLQEVAARYPNAEELFFDIRNRNIYEAIRDSGQNNPVALQELLRQRAQLDGMGGMPYVAALMKDVSGLTIEAEQYSDILARDYTRRRLIQAAHRIDRASYETEGAAEALELAEKLVMEIGNSLQSDTDPNTKELVHAVLNQMEAAHQNQGIMRGLATGYPDFDCMTHGLKPGQMIVIAARPAVGKTSLAMNIAEHVAIEQKYPVGVFSLEMTADELIYRMTCSRARIDSNTAQSGTLQERDFHRLTKASGQIANAPLHICEKSGLTISQLAARARRMHQRHKLRLLIIDYLQLLQSRIKGNRNDQITEISNGIKTLAKDLKIPIIVIAQLNRDVEKEERAPRPSDLRDSGSIEQDADIIALLNPERPKDGEAMPDNQRVQALIPKHRGGPTGAVNLLFMRAITRFESASPVQD